MFRTRTETALGGGYVANDFLSLTGNIVSVPVLYQQNRQMAAHMSHLAMRHIVRGLTDNILTCSL